MKIFLLIFTVFFISGCNQFDTGILENNSIKLYGYEKNKDCSRDDCKLDKNSEILFLINPNNQTITYKLKEPFVIEKKSTAFVSSYGYLKDCKIVSKKDFSCEEISSDDGVFNVNKQIYDLKTEKFIDKKNAFSEFNYIGSSLTVHYIADIFPFTRSSLEVLDKYSYAIFIFGFFVIIGCITN